MAVALQAQEVMEEVITEVMEEATEQVGGIATEKTHAAVTMVPEVVEPGAVLDMTRQGFCLTSALGETTCKKQRTGTWAKVQGILMWSRYRPTSDRTYVAASFPSFYCCSWCLSSCTSCHN